MKQADRQEIDMILKVGYFGKDGIEGYRYFDDFDNVGITGVESDYILDTEECVFKRGKFPIDDPSLIFFDPSERSNNTHIVYIAYYSKGGGMDTMAALGGTVYLMNDNGKTVDKY